MNKTLIVIDLQNGFMNKPYYLKLRDRLQEYIDNSKYERIIFTKFKNDCSRNPFYEEKINWHRLKDSNEQELCLKLPKDSIVFEKYGYSLQNKDLEYLKSLKERDIDICGLKANACVYAISLQLFDNGIYPNILWNYVECEPNLKESMKQIFVGQFGKVDER